MGNQIFCSSDLKFTDILKWAPALETRKERNEYVPSLYIIIKWARHLYMHFSLALHLHVLQSAIGGGGGCYYSPSPSSKKILLIINPEDQIIF